MTLTSVRRDGGPAGARPKVTGIERLRAAFGPDRRSVIAYVPFGDPAAGDDRILDTYRGAGVAALEVGIPTRDAWLDGPEVADSMRRAIDAGTDPGSVAERLAAWRTGLDGPSPAVVLFSYPTLSLAAIERAAALGVIDGLLMIEPWRHPEAARLPGLLASLGVAFCTFLPWDPTDLALRTVAATTGYVMVQARSGSTGVGRDPGVPTRQVALARRSAPGVPCVAGFGIHDAATVRRVVRADVDGVVVGSACVRAARDGGATALEALLRGLVAAAGQAGSRAASARDAGDATATAPRVRR